MSKSEMVYECSDPEGVFVYCPQDSIICHKWNGTTACGCQYAKQGSITLPEDKSEKPRCTNCQRYTYCTLELVDASRCESYLRNIPVSESSNVKGKCQRKDCLHYGEICCACESECDGESHYEKYAPVKEDGVDVSGYFQTVCDICNGRNKCCIPIFDCKGYKELQVLLSLSHSQGYAQGREDMAREIIELVERMKIPRKVYDEEAGMNEAYDKVIDLLKMRIDTLSRKEDKG